MKVVKFIKENKTIIFALLVVILSFVLLALPGQFAHYGFDGVKNGRNIFKYNLSGYQFMFGTYKNPHTSATIGGPVAQGIAIFVMLILCACGLVFAKKSSFVSLLVSLSLVVIAILFFTISVAGAKVYKGGPDFLPADSTSKIKYSLYTWVPYVLGGLIMLAGLLMCYRTFKVMKDEVKRPQQAKGPSYSYLHK